MGGLILFCCGLGSGEDFFFVVGGVRDAFCMCYVILCVFVEGALGHSALVCAKSGKNQHSFEHSTK